MQKKENAKVREEVDYYQKIIEERNDDEEEVDVDRIDTNSQAAYPGAMQSKMSRGNEYAFKSKTNAAAAL